MNNQEAFTKMVQHLREQKTPALNEYGSCVYLNDDGQKCAVGALIPDGHKAQKEGDTTADQLRQLYPDLFPNVDTYLLLEMQKVHDSFDPANWEDQFSKVAEDYGLEVPA